VNVEVSGIDHIYLTVADLQKSIAFYDPVMKMLGFRKGTLPIAGEPHVHYFNRVTQISLRPARDAGVPHDPYAPGLHHLCLRVEGAAQVDEVAHHLRAMGVAASEPKLYPEYSADYYATFFEDPDGIRLEIVAFRKLRQIIRDQWEKLSDFENPVSKAGLSP
jgi:catechol 2,3-dioxygenase-like lactoylglutathione lyase family enzyme